MANTAYDGIVRAVAKSLNVDPDLAVATEHVESQGNPQAVGDQGTSFGLFQLHQGGELGNLTPQQAFDPTTNATRALTQFRNVQMAYPNIRDPGQIAAMAQRPANPTAYASAVDKEYAKVKGGGGGSGFWSTVGGALVGAGGGTPVGVGGLLVQGAANGGQVISDTKGLIQFVTSGQNWLRLGEIIGGGILIILGVIFAANVLGGTDIPKAVTKVGALLPQAKFAKTVKGGQ